MKKNDARFQMILDALTEYGVPPDAQEAIVLGSYAWFRNSSGMTELRKMIYRDDYVPPNN